MRTKLFILTSRFPYPIEKGDKLRVYRQIIGLAEYHDIILCSLTTHDIPNKDHEELAQYCSKIYTFKTKKTDLLINLISGFLKGLPLQVAYFYKSSINKKIQEIVKTEQPDFMYCQLARMAEYARHLDIPKTIDYMDAFSVNARRWSQNASFYLRPFLSREARKMQEYETLIFKDFQGHSIISQQDREHLKIEQKEQINIIPNGVDFNFFKPDHAVKKDYDLAFVGNMGYAPNVEAARYLVQDILPLLKVKFPKIKILIAGARPTPEVRKLESEQVTITGWLDDIRSAYNSAEIFVAPLFMGAGLQNKILEAMAMCLPCVTTPMVNNAIGAKQGTTVFLAHDAQSFADAIIKLKENVALSKKIAQQSQIFVRENFAWDNFVEDLNQLIKKK